MAKPKQKKSSQSKLNKKKFLLYGVIALVVLVAAFTVIRILEHNKAIEDQKNIMNRSLDATRTVYERFSNEVSNHKENTQPTEGRCTSAGKYSTRYTCGPEAQMTVNGLDESRYRSLNDLALRAYKDSGYFEQISATEPHENGLDPGLTGTAGSRLSESDMRCYYSSNYNQDRMTATFAWGCKQVSNNRYF